jgi:uncharacterized protein
VKIVILGATGFIGRALVLALQGRGDTVRVLARNPKHAVVPAGVEVVDFADDAATRHALGDADAAINLAGESIAGKRWTKARKQALVDSRIATTKRLVDVLASRPRPLPVLVSASASGFYGDRGEEILDEESAPGEGFAAELCLAWETATDGANAKRVVHPRFGIVLGREGGALDALLPIYRLGLGGPIGGGQQWMSWIHLADAVGAILHAVDTPIAGPLNVTAPAIRQRDFALALGRVLGRPTFVPTPAFAVKLALGEAAAIVLASQRMVSRIPLAFPTIDDALHDILTDDGVTFESSHDLPQDPYVQERHPRYTLHARTELAAPISDVFGFFASPENLAALTPPDLAFEIATPRPIAMGAGTLIDYTIRVAGVPLRWRTRIERWTEDAGFVDAQLRGPYRAWFHEHRFTAAGDSTIMEDVVHYAPPLGVLGAVANKLFVERMLRRIFGYRRQAIRLRFTGA